MLNAAVLAAFQVPTILKNMETATKGLSTQALGQAKQVTGQVKNLATKGQKLSSYNPGSSVPNIPKPSSPTSVSKKLFNMVN